MLEPDIIEFIFTPSCVKSECDQEDPHWFLTPPQTQTVENRESDSKPMNLKPFGTVTYLKGLDIPCDPPDNQNNTSRHRSSLSSDPVGLDRSPPLHPSPLLDPSCPKVRKLDKNGKKLEQRDLLSEDGSKKAGCGQHF